MSLILEIRAAKKRFGLPEDAQVVCCYEAGRDGFWPHRFLLAHGVQNQVVDSSSIEVNRRQRRAKSDRLDATSWASRGQILFPVFEIRGRIELRYQSDQKRKVGSPAVQRRRNPCENRNAFGGLRG